MPIYQEVSDRQLYCICNQELNDLEIVLSAFLKWVEDHLEKIDQGL